MFYCVDTKTGKRHSLHTCIEDEARQIIEAKNQALRQPAINLQIAHPAALHIAPAARLRRLVSRISRVEYCLRQIASRTEHFESHVCEKLFKAGKIRHHARSFRNQFRIIASRTAGKHFV